MIIYRINIEVGYREVQLQFNTSEEAGKFAEMFVSHSIPNKNGQKAKLSLEVLDSESINEEDEEDDED